MQHWKTIWKTVVKITRFTRLSLLILTGTMLILRAEPCRTDINPASLYYRAFLMPWQPMSDADRDYLTTKQGWNKSSRNGSGQSLPSMPIYTASTLGLAQESF